MDLAGYFQSIERCREQFPGLRILSGVELGEPHRHASACAQVLAGGQFDRVVASLHSLKLAEQFAEPPRLYQQMDPPEVIRRYLTEAAELVATWSSFDVLGHIDYPLRSWPRSSPFDAAIFEDEFRHVLHTLATSGRALEVSTRVPLPSRIVGWWREEGGKSISFGSDAHDPMRLAHDFVNAAEMVEAHGFRAGHHAHDLWRLTTVM